MCLLASVFGIDIDEVINQSIEEVSIMQERRFMIKAGRQDADEALRNHRPGTTHRHSDGVTYVVQPNCSWKRVTPKSAVLRKRAF